MKNLIELFFGKWECVVAEVNDIGIAIVCYRHSVTNRVKGYVNSGKGRYWLDTRKVLEHIKHYSKGEQP